MNQKTTWLLEWRDALEVKQNKLAALGGEASYPMVDFMNPPRENMHWNNTMKMIFDICIFVCKNKLGARLFRDPLPTIVVKLEEKPSMSL